MTDTASDVVAVVNAVIGVMIFLAIITIKEYFRKHMFLFKESQVSESKKTRNVHAMHQFSLIE